MKNRRKLDACPNCGEEHGDRVNFCPQCGQENRERRVRAKDLLLDFLGDYLTFDSKVFRSLIPLVTRPGWLVKEFRLGRRSRYIPPLRLYLVISALYFFMLSTDGNPQIDMKVGEADFRAGEFSQMTGGQRDELVDRIKESARQGDEMERLLGGQIAKILREGGLALFLGYMTKALSLMMFLLMPLMALLLMVFFRRADFFFVEHLVFSLHFHAFFFLWQLFYLLADLAVGGIYDLRVSLVILVAYLYCALKVVYDTKVGSGVAATVFVSALYGVVVALSLAATVFAGFLLY